MSAAKDLARKKRDYPTGDYVPTPEETEAYIHCVRNNIRISPSRVAYGVNKWYISIFAKGKWNNSPDSYGPKEVWEVFYNYCKYYYVKN